MLQVSTEDHEVISTCDDLNDYQGEERVMLLIPGNKERDFAMIACETLYDVAYHAVQDGGMMDAVDDADIEEWVLLKIHILDPTDLPYNIESGRGNCVYIIFDDELMYRAETIEEATRYIEGFFKSKMVVNIEDFAVMSASKLHIHMVHRLKDLIDMFESCLPPEEEETKKAGEGLIEI